MIKTERSGAQAPRCMESVASSLLKQVGISKNIPPTTPIGSLSGGERQAIAIARAIHFDSDLIILDEPTNNLGVADDIDPARTTVEEVERVITGMG